MSDPRPVELAALSRLHLGAATSDGNTIRMVREQLIQARALDTLFADFDHSLKEQGYLPVGGQIVDAKSQRPIRAFIMWERGSPRMRGQFRTIVIQGEFAISIISSHNGVSRIQYCLLKRTADFLNAIRLHSGRTIPI